MEMKNVFGGKRSEIEKSLPEDKNPPFYGAEISAEIKEKIRKMCEIDDEMSGYLNEYEV